MLAGQDAMVVTEDGDGAPKQHTHSYCCLDYPSFVDVVQACHPLGPAPGLAAHGDHMAGGLSWFILVPLACFSWALHWYLRTLLLRLLRLYCPRLQSGSYLAASSSICSFNCNPGGTV